MSKKTGGVLTLAAMCGLSLFLFNCGSSSSRPSGLLYVVDGSKSQIDSFSIDLNSGNLSLINTKATTCSTLTQSPQVFCGQAVSMVLEPTQQKTVFLLNEGVPCVPGVSCVNPCGPPNQACTSIPPTIYGYTVNSDGSLSSPATPVIWGHPSSSSDTEDDADTAVAMVQDAAGSFLFVINSGSTPTEANDYLSKCPYAPNSPPPPIAPTANFDACPSISVFSTTPGSTGATLTGNDCPNTSNVCPYWLSRVPTALSVLTFTPPNGGTTQTLLFVTSKQDLTANHNDNELSVFNVDMSSGNLTELSGSPYTTAPNPTVVQAVNTNAAGQTIGGVFVYVGNKGSSGGSVSAFQVCTVVGSQGGGQNCTQANDQLIPIGTTSGAGSDPVAMVVDPTNSFLYTASSGSNLVFAFKIATGTGLLSTLTPASEPSQGSNPVALAMHPSSNTSNEFLFVSNQSSSSGSGNIGIFSVGVTSGSLSNPTTFMYQPGTPGAMVAK